MTTSRPLLQSASPFGDCVTVVAEFENTEDARAFVADETLKDAMRSAGVTGAPRIEIFEELEAVQY